MNVDRLSFDAIEVRTALQSGKSLSRVAHGSVELELVHWRSDLLVLVRRGEKGGLALRCPLLDEGSKITVEGSGDVLLRWRSDNAAGLFQGELRGEETGLPHFVYRVTLKPHQDLHIPYLPRDLVPFVADGDPLGSEGKVMAVQRKLNTGLCFFALDRPALGAVLYVQNLTALNPYYKATGTKPENAVGGEWPMLGYLPPTQPGKEDSVLKGGKEIVLYDTRLVIRGEARRDESESAWQFLDMLGAVYRGLDKPVPQMRDWPQRARRTLRDLEQSPKVRDAHYGHTYFHPYTCAEYPDSMVQLSLLSAIQDWSAWTGEKHPLEREIFSGLQKFYDPKLKAIRRYLPDVGKDKDADAVDSWYPYHTLLNLSNVALAGHKGARELFLKSIDWGIKSAHHFKYKWPIQYKITDFSVIVAVADADDRGQTDVGGIYAWLMLQAFELTGEARFLKEAEAALEAARGMRFDLNYQANLTAWGAAAAIRLWRTTNRKTYLALSYVYLASFFHNAQMWESEIGWASEYSNFLGVTCLQDAPYMALYECFDSFAAFERFLDLGGPDLIPSAKLLLIDYCRYALWRAWWYYPDALPKEALATELRNGEIDCKLSFPVEDLYPDGQPAGQVGQEVYGGGAAMIFATRAFHRLHWAPFDLFCDHFIRAMARQDHQTLSFRLDGEHGQTAELHLIPKGKASLGRVVVRTLEGNVLSPRCKDGEAGQCYQLPAAAGVVISWDERRT